MRHAKQAHTRIPVPARPGACQLTVRDLGVTLEGTEILQDVSFQLNCREIVALIGPNGARTSSGACGIIRRNAKNLTRS